MERKRIRHFAGEFSKNRNSLSGRLRRLILGTISLVIVSVLISVSLITIRERKKYQSREAENMLQTLSASVDNALQNYKELSRLIMMDESLADFMRADADSVDIGTINDTRYGIMDILMVTEGVDSVMVFREDMIRVATNRFSYKYDSEKLQSMDWREEIYRLTGRATVGLNTFGVASKPDGRPMVTIGRAMYDMLTQQRTGILLMNISPEVFQRMLGNYRSDAVCIMGVDGTFLAGDERLMQFYTPEYAGGQVVHRELRDGMRQLLLSGCQVEDTPIVILRGIYYGTEGIPYGILVVILIMFLFFVFVAVFFGGFVSRNITRPIEVLSESMDENVRSGELRRIDTELPGKELGMLKEDYNSLIDHVNSLIETLIEKEKTLQRAEMRVLQEQIKPHFLYNSLETIGSLAVDAGADRVQDALETLGSFYRNFLSKGDREISLEREVQIVRDYLALQKLRYGEIIEDEYEIGEETKGIVVPKLILQPLVENSIYHGIRLKGENGIIRVKAFVSDRILHLSVYDTGVGMTREQIDRLLSAGHTKEESDSESFGLWGTIERVRIYCGREDVVRIRSEIGEYTEVEFLIPLPERKAAPDEI
ncbi:MAG: histidine kinase [Lachnospiraceae bacterium]|nr:histidine kinase [Lachnospiraceae bacterium]